jgi:hypothetical protein
MHIPPIRIHAYMYTIYHLHISGICCVAGISQFVELGDELKLKNLRRLFNIFFSLGMCARNP